MLRIGQTVRLLVDYAGTPNGAEGMIVSSDSTESGDTKYGVEWLSQSEDNPPTDWFTEDEAFLYLEILD